MVHGRGSGRSATRGGLCAAAMTAMVALLALTLLHAMLSLGASHPPPHGPDRCGTGAVSPAAAAPSASASSVSSVSPPSGASPSSSAPADEDDPSPARRVAALPSAGAGGLPGHTGHTGHAGRVCGTSVGGPRSLPTVPHHLVVAAARVRPSGHAMGIAASGARSEPSPLQQLSRAVVLRC